MTGTMTKMTKLEQDLAFIAADWNTLVIPKDKKYLHKYFRSKLQKLFLRYFLIFGEWTHFTEHTGQKVQKHWLRALHRKLIKVEAAHAEAKANFDLEKLVLIERGKLK